MEIVLVLANLVEKVVSREVAGSPHREELSRGILRLQESGKMEMLAKKWIGLEGSGCAAEQEGILNWLSGIF